MLPILPGLKQQKTFSVFPYSYRNTSGSLGEQEIEVEFFHVISSSPKLFSHNAPINVKPQGGGDGLPTGY